MELKKSEEIRFEEIKAQVCYCIDVNLLSMHVYSKDISTYACIGGIILYLLFHVVKGTEQ